MPPVDKLYRLRSSPSPRLILVGGSNLTMGLDSVVLDKAFDYSVVNMGLHAGVDSEAMWWQIEDAIAPGDIIVFRPGCDAWFQTLVDEINRELGTRLRVETLETLPEGGDSCLRRLWLEREQG